MLAAVDQYGKALEDRVKKQAKDIREKYIEAPHTTDFSVAVPAGGEPLRRGSSAPWPRATCIQREHQVTLAGPTTLAAILNSLQMGFRTLAIEQRSGEVWRLLGAVKTDFGTFGDLLARTQEAARHGQQYAGRRGSAGRGRSSAKLRGVEALPEAEAARLLSHDSGPVIDLEPEAEDRCRSAIR